MKYKDWQVTTQYLSNILRTYPWHDAPVQQRIPNIAQIQPTQCMFEHQHGPNIMITRFHYDPYFSLRSLVQLWSLWSMILPTIRRLCKWILIPYRTSRVQRRVDQNFQHVGLWEWHLSYCPRVSYLGRRPASTRRWFSFKKCTRPSAPQPNEIRFL